MNNKVYMKEQTIAIQLRSDSLFMHSALTTCNKKDIQVIKLGYKNKWNLRKNSQAVKKGVA